MKTLSLFTAAFLVAAPRLMAGGASMTYSGGTQGALTNASGSGAATVSTSNGTVYITDEPQTRGEVHAAQTLEYLCAYEPKYHTPPNRPGKEPWWVKWRAERLARQRKSEDPCILLAPTGSLKR
jgi:hypothetical protein